MRKAKARADAAGAAHQFSAPPTAPDQRTAARESLHPAEGNKGRAEAAARIPQAAASGGAVDGEQVRAKVVIDAFSSPSVVRGQDRKERHQPAQQQHFPATLPCPERKMKITARFDNHRRSPARSRHRSRTRPAQHPRLVWKQDRGPGPAHHGKKAAPARVIPPGQRKRRVDQACPNSVTRTAPDPVGARQDVVGGSRWRPTIPGPARDGQHHDDRRQSCPFRDAFHLCRAARSTCVPSSRAVPDGNVDLVRPSRLMPVPHRFAPTLFDARRAWGPRSRPRFRNPRRGRARRTSKFGTATPPGRAAPLPRTGPTGNTPPNTEG